MKKKTRRLLGTSKVSTNNKITLIKDVVAILGIKEGDKIAFYEEDGKIIIEKA